MGTLNCTNVNATQVTVGTGGVAFQDGSSMPSAQTGTLNDLNNVSAGSPSTGQFLQWNGSNWVNATVQQGIESGTRSQRPSSNQLTTFRWNTETQVHESYFDYSGENNVAGWHAVGGRQLIAHAQRKDAWSSFDLYWGQSVSRTSGRYAGYEIMISLFEPNGDNGEYYMRFIRGNGNVDNGGRYFHTVRSHHINDGFPRNNENGQDLIRLVNSDNSYDMGSNGESSMVYRMFVGNTPNSSTCNYWAYCIEGGGFSGQGGQRIHIGGNWRCDHAESNSYPINGIQMICNRNMRSVGQGVNCIISVMGVSGFEGAELYDSYMQP